MSYKAALPRGADCLQEGSFFTKLSYVLHFCDWLRQREATPSIDDGNDTLYLDCILSQLQISTHLTLPPQLTNRSILNPSFFSI